MRTTIMALILWPIQTVEALNPGRRLQQEQLKGSLQFEHGIHIVGGLSNCRGGVMARMSPTAFYFVLLPTLINDLQSSCCPPLKRRVFLS